MEHYENVLGTLLERSWKIIGTPLEHYWNIGEPAFETLLEQSKGGSRVMVKP